MGGRGIGNTGEFGYILESIYDSSPTPVCFAATYLADAKYYRYMITIILLLFGTVANLLFIYVV